MPMTMSNGKGDRQYDKDLFGFGMTVKFKEEHLKDLPTEVDWRKKGVVTRVYRQGQCGSCWAFAAAQAIESSYAVVHKKRKTLSPQQFLDCTSMFYGCNGGRIDIAFLAARRDPVYSSASYPY